jgi:hypothetical protein
MAALALEAFVVILAQFVCCPRMDFPLGLALEVGFLDTASDLTERSNCPHGMFATASEASTDPNHAGHNYATIGRIQGVKTPRAAHIFDGAQKFRRQNSPREP